MFAGMQKIARLAATFRPLESRRGSDHAVGVVLQRRAFALLSIQPMLALSCVLTKTIPRFVYPDEPLVALNLQAAGSAWTLTLTAPPAALTFAPGVEGFSPSDWPAKGVCAPPAELQPYVTRAFTDCG